MRANDPPVMARIEENRLLLDLRTVLPDEEEELVTLLTATRVPGKCLPRFTRIFWPSVMNGGTCTTRPVSIFAGLVTLETLAPLIPGSVSTTVMSTVAGSSTPIALPSWNSTVTFNCGIRYDRVAQQILHEVHLLVRFGVHEVVVFAVVVQVLHLLLFEQGLLHPVFRREAVLDHSARTQAAHPRLHEAAQVAGRTVRHGKNGIQFVVELDHHSRTQMCC